LAPPGFAREDWQILRALSEELNCPLPYDSLDEVRTRLAELAPHLVKYNYIEPSGFEGLSLKSDADVAR
jgi:NADH dehydrogenase (ubiquinone) Fe-S protein 1